MNLEKAALETIARQVANQIRDDPEFQDVVTTARASFAILRHRNNVNNLVQSVLPELERASTEVGKRDISKDARKEATYERDLLIEEIRVTMTAVLADLDAALAEGRG